MTLREWIEIDDAWSAELQRLFGDRAGDVRYTKQGEGELGTKLNETYLSFVRARDEYRQQIWGK